jgi:hypothetical protein
VLRAESQPALDAKLEFIQFGGVVEGGADFRQRRVQRRAGLAACRRRRNAYPLNVTCIAGPVMYRFATWFSARYVTVAVTLSRGTSLK